MKTAKRPESKTWSWVLKEHPFCRFCGRFTSYNQRSLHVHHWDCNPYNNAPSNLWPVCKQCHTKLHLPGVMGHLESLMEAGYIIRRGMAES